MVAQSCESCFFYIDLVTVCSELKLVEFKGDLLFYNTNLA